MNTFSVTIKNLIYKMLWKLQIKTFLPLQLIGYAITLCIGVIIILTTYNIYKDIQPLLKKETDVFGNNGVVISKEISDVSSVFGGLNSIKGNNVDRSSIYFTNEEISIFKKQSFVKNISFFNTASGFNIYLYINELGIRTDIFFESIPDKYLGTVNDNDLWKWDEKEKFIPIIIPKDYLKILNLGYAESRKSSGIPLLSYNAVKWMKGEILIKSKIGKEKFTCQIVGFTEKVNSILVPNDFLIWANKNYGDGKKSKPNKLIVEFNNSNSPEIIKYLKENKYEINKRDIEFNKLINIFRIAFFLIFIIATVIISLSISFVLLSVNLIFQKNKTVLINLYNIGYNLQKISLLYKIIISGITFISISTALIISNFIRGIYRQNLSTLFEINLEKNNVYIATLAITILFILLINIFIKKKIHNIITN
tara:strand:+ start:587 stop:1855 length:1269 start_codon:yes stop_codon:yes gene_type:complete